MEAVACLLLPVLKETKKNMKKYDICKDVKKRYLIAGIGAMILLLINILFYLLAFPYGLLHILRCNLCYLKLDNTYMRFYDGIIDWKKIPVKKITKIEYNPKIMLRFYLENMDTPVRIPNIFATEDIENIFLTLRQYKASIDIQYVFKSKQNKR